MGGRRSGRWRNHRKRRLVESTPCLDFHKSPWKEVLTNQKATSGRMVCPNQLGNPGWIARFQLETTTDVTKRLKLDFSAAPTEPPQIVVLEQVPAGFTSRWCAICPMDCGRKVQRIYIVGQRPTAACRTCLGLTHRSSQQHDGRRDFAGRDPGGFLESRSRAPRTPRSRMVTAWLAFEGLQRATLPRKGRGWGRKSITTFDRVQAKLQREWEDRWGRPFPTLENPLPKSELTSEGG